MSNIFSTQNIIDRIDETRYVVEDINKNKCKNKVLFIWSDSGLGKTSIVKKASLNDELSKPIIIVDTPPINKKELVGNGDFISYVSEAISNYFQNEKMSLKDFLALGMSERLKKSEGSKVLENLDNLPAAVFSALCERILSLNVADAEKIINGYDLDSILINCEYVKYMIETYRFVLNISNIQNADSMSIMQLQKIMDANNGLYFIFEYTTKNKKTDELWKLAKIFENVADVDVYEINELPIEYALTIVNPSNYNMIDELECFYKNIAKGNLYKLCKIKNELDGSSILKLKTDPIKTKIDKLNYQQKLLLSIICLHDGNISIDEFEDIINFISKKYYVSYNDIHGLKDLIEKTDKLYKLQHASIIDSLEIGIENFASVTAYKFLQEYYTEKIKNNAENENLKNEYNFQILKLYSIFEPTKIVNRLDDFKSIIISCISETQGEKLLNKIFYSFPNNTNDKIKLYIVNLAYEVGFYKTAYNLLKKIYSNTEEKNILECMLLNRIDRHYDTIKKCKILLKEKGHTSRFYLIINMIKMLSERSLNLVTEYQKTFKKVFKNKKYEDLYEYGFLLRNSQIIFSYKDSLQYINESMNFFSSKKANKDAACSELTYAVQLSRLGFLEEANNHINNIKFTLLNSTFEKHIVYLNQSSLALLSDSSNEETLLLLEKSLLSATTNFDKIAILNNKLCWYIKHGVEDRLFQNLKSQLDQLLLIEPDSRLHRRVYINYSNYYKYVSGNDVISNAWLKNASEIPSNNDELGDIYIHGINENSNYDFLSKQKIYVSFITYWHFDLPMN